MYFFYFKLINLFLDPLAIVSFNFSNVADIYLLPLEQKNIEGESATFSVGRGVNTQIDMNVNLY